MFKFKQTILMLCLFFSGALCYAHGEVKTTVTKDGIPIELKESACSTSPSKIQSIVASIDGHVLSVVFTQNFGQVVVEVTTAEGGEVDVDSIQTPNGVNFYIPNSGSYVVIFTFPDGDVYYGEFEVTD